MSKVGPSKPQQGTRQGQNGLDRLLMSLLRPFGKSGGSDAPVFAVTQADPERDYGLALRLLSRAATIAADEGWGGEVTISHGGVRTPIFAPVPPDARSRTQPTLPLAISNLRETLNERRPASTIARPLAATPQPPLG
jgi:hypothetical protein